MPGSGMVGWAAGGMESDGSDSGANLERSADSRPPRGFRRREDRFGNQVSADSASRGPFVRCPTGGFRFPGAVEPSTVSAASDKSSQREAIP